MLSRLDEQTTGLLVNLKNIGKHQKNEKQANKEKKYKNNMENTLEIRVVMVVSQER